MPVILNRILQQVGGHVVGRVGQVDGQIRCGLIRADLERPGLADMCDSVLDLEIPAIRNGILRGPSGQVGMPLGDDRRCGKSVQQGCLATRSVGNWPPPEM